MQNIQEIIKEKGLVGTEAALAEDIAKRLLGDEMKLTKDEQRMILQHRENIKKRLAHKAWTKRILETAFNFNQWLNTHDVRPTYSTFCDGFGYSQYDECSEFIYTVVLKIIDMAEKAAGEKVS